MGSSFHSFSGHLDYVRSVSFSPDGRRIVSGSEDFTIKHWDILTRKTLRTFQVYSDKEITTLKQTYPDLKKDEFEIYVAFSPDGKTILSGSGWNNVFGALTLWDTETGQKIHGIPKAHDKSHIRDVIFFHNARFALSASHDRSIRLWDLNRKRQIFTFFGHTMSVNGVVFDPSSEDPYLQRILSCSTDQTIKSWDLFRLSAYAKFHTRVSEATRTLQMHPADAEGLKVLGEWYAFRGHWDWAIEALQGGAKNGANVAALTLARCYWQLGDLEAARREFLRALKQKEDQEDYLKLCLSAVERDLASSGKAINVKS